VHHTSPPSAKSLKEAIDFATEAQKVLLPADDAAVRQFDAKLAAELNRPSTTTDRWFARQYAPRAEVARRVV
jgi:hypothetical protein